MMFPDTSNEMQRAALRLAAERAHRCSGRGRAPRGQTEASVPISTWHSRDRERHGGGLTHQQQAVPEPPRRNEPSARQCCRARRRRERRDLS